MAQEDQSALFRLRQSLDDENIMLCFNGPLNQSIIEEIGIALRRHLEDEAMSRTVVGDVFSVYIEQTQNIRNYAARSTDDARERARLNAAIVVIERTDEGYAVNSGNLIYDRDFEPLAQRLDALQKMDKTELKAHYKAVLKAPVDEGQSAGLGLISMARSASEPISYGYRKLDEVHGFFSLKVTIKGSVRS
jgi:hypothetical protein